MSEVACEGCGLLHKLWVTTVPGLGRQHDRAPLGFDGTIMKQQGVPTVDRVWVSAQVDFTRTGWPVCYLCQWCAMALQRRIAILDGVRRRARDRHLAEVLSGQQGLALD